MVIQGELFYLNKKTGPEPVVVVQVFLGVAGWTVDTCQPHITHV